MKTAPCAVLVLWALMVPVSAQVVLNEICADNSSIQSAAGTFPDYVELYNPGTSSVPLSGWSLTDDLTKPTKWAFPTGTTISAKGHLVIWLDNTDRYPGLIVTNFSLRSSGEQVALFQNSNLRDYLRFGPQIKDRTICRYPNGGTNWTLGLQTPGATNISTALGTPFALRINELLAVNSIDSDWLELYNPATNLPVSIGNMVLADTNNITGFPALWPHGFIDSDGFVQFFCAGDTNRGDHLVFKLNSAGETVRLYASNRATLVDSITFGLQQPDISFGRLPDGGTNLFFFSPTNRATPGAPNDWLNLSNVIVNEVIAHTNSALEQAVELVNVTDQPVDISNWWLSNSRQVPLKFHIPAGTVIPAHGFKVFYEQIGTTNAGFNRSGTGFDPDFSFNWAHGDDVVLTSGTATTRVTGQRNARTVPVAASGVSIGRHIKSDGGTDFVSGSRRSFGQDTPTNTADFRLGTGLSNAYPLIGPIVLSEIMYHPPDVVIDGVTNDNSLDEYIVLKSITNSIVRLYDAAYPTNTWHIEGGVSFRFPTNVTVAPSGAVLVLNFDPKTNLIQLAAFRSKYSMSTNVACYGPYSGKLNNKSDTIEVYRPGTVLLPPRLDAGFVPNILVEKIKFQDSTPWPVGTGNTGQSLQRLSHTGYANDQTNWIAGLPTLGKLAPAMPPILTLQPRSQSLFVGQTATFSVTADGMMPLYYYWRKGATTLPNSNGPTLTITNLQLSDAGAYSVIVSNGQGSVTSAVAQLTVRLPPQGVGPAVTITAPANKSRVFSPTVTLKGTARGGVAVEQVEVRVGNGPYENAIGTANWTADLELSPGTNVIRARGRDTSGRYSTEAIWSLVYVVTSPLTLVVSPGGKIVGAANGQSLEVGRSYSLTVVPAPGFLFSNWTGGIVSSANPLRFVMTSNLFLEANCVTNPFLPVAGMFNGLYRKPGTPEHGSSGAFKAALQGSGAYSGNLQTGARKLAFSGRFGLDGRSTNSVARPGALPLTVELWLRFGTNDGLIGRVTDGNWRSELIADRAVYSASNPATNFARQYAMIIPGGANGSLMEPAGEGFAAVTISRAGVATFMHSLADGTPGVLAVPLSKNGGVPWYVSLYGGRGSALGWLRFGTIADPDLDGDVAWFKPVGATPPLYTNGFVLEARATGSAYAPLGTNRLFEASNATIQFAEGGLTNAYAIAVALWPKGQVTADATKKLVFKTVTGTGLFSGNAVLPGAMRSIPFKGVLLQHQGYGSGYFLNAGQSGRLWMMPDPSPP